MRDGARGIAEVRRLAVLPERARDADDQCDERGREADRQEMAAIVAATAERDRGEVRERQGEELDSGRDGEQADERDGDTPLPATAS